MGRVDDAGHVWTALLRICKQEVRSSSLLVGSQKSAQCSQEAKVRAKQPGSLSLRTPTHYHYLIKCFRVSTARRKQHAHASTRSRCPITGHGGRCRGAAPPGEISIGADRHAGG